MRELLIIRHGETTANVAGRWQGHGDSPLTERGQSQARALGCRFAGERFDAVYSSDLVRARDTADQLDGPRYIDPRFRELSVGRWEGCTRDEVLRQWPQDFEGILRDPSIPIGGGESWLQIGARAEAGLARLRAAHPGGRVALVAHGGFNLSALEGLLGLDWRWPRRLGRIRNTAVAEVHFTPEGAARLVRYNDVDHLDPPEPVPIETGADSVIEPVGDPETVATALGVPAERIVALQAGRAGSLLRHGRNTQLLGWNAAHSH